MWKQWSADTVEKFLGWLYTNDYTIPLPTDSRQRVKDDAPSRRPGSSDDNKAVNDEFPYSLQEEEWRMPDDPAFELAPVVEVSQKMGKKTKSKKKGSFSQTPPTEAEPGPLVLLKDLSWRGSHAVDKTMKTQLFEKQVEVRLRGYSQHLDYGVTLMTHATLYVVACEKNLIELKNMAWQRLRSLLIAIGGPVAGKPIVGNLVALSQYAYQETGVSELPQDPLRDLLTSYVAIHFTKFQGPEVDGLFSSQATDDRDFVVEVMIKVRHRMLHFEGAGQAWTDY